MAAPYINNFVTFDDRIFKYQLLIVEMERKYLLRRELSYSVEALH